MKSLLRNYVSFVALFAVLGVLIGAPGSAAAPPQEGTAAACNPSSREGTRRCGRRPSIFRRGCYRSKDDPEMKQPGAKCKTYCKPENCDCQNSCTS
jgi:hypothetical protein